MESMWEAKMQLSLLDSVMQIKEAQLMIVVP